LDALDPVIVITQKVNSGSILGARGEMCQEDEGVRKTEEPTADLHRPVDLHMLPRIREKIDITQLTFLIDLV
jgi:hypothetical protein